MPAAQADADSTLAYLRGYVAEVLRRCLQQLPRTASHSVRRMKVSLKAHSVRWVH